MSIPSSRPCARAMSFAAGLTLATAVLAGPALAATSAQSVVPRNVVTNGNRVQSVAVARSYSGRYPFSVTNARFHNGTGCLTLTDDASEGWPNSGHVTSAGRLFGGSGTFGIFQVINGILEATVPQSSGTGGSSSLVFTAPANNGAIGNGAFEQVYGGEFDSGLLAFGLKGGC